MIGRAFPYNGSEAEARQLDSHLWKDDGQRPDLSELRNLFVHDSGQGMAVMAALRAASNAKIAFWHIIVSPRKTLDAKERATVVDLVIAELKAVAHPLMVFSHNEKPRARQGGGGNHLHLVLGHVSPVSFRALDMRQYAPRLHKVAAYQIEGVATASPWHKSIVRTLRAEGNLQVAAWLVDSLGEAPVLKRPRMTDSMRRSAQAAGFALPSFQAGLARLWTTGAAQPDLEAFLSENGVAIRAGRSPHRVAFYHGELFLGTLDRILRLDPATVYDQAKLRFPGLLGANAVQAFSESIRNSKMHQPEQPKRLEVPGSTRRLDLERQRKVDDLEEKLACLRLERLHLIYDRARAYPQAEVPVLSGAPLLQPDHLLDHDGQSRPRDETPYTANPHAVDRGRLQGEMADHIKRLLHAEAILEAAVLALWQDHRWISESSLELLRFAEKSVTSCNVNAAARAGTSAGELDAGVEHEPSRLPHPR
jgi:hypothetical protein